MSVPTKTSSAGALPDAVAHAVDAIVEALQLRPAGRRQLVDFVAGLATPYPKLPHVRFYAARTRHGGTNFRVTYRIAGHKIRTERLGKIGKVAYQRAQRVSEVLAQVAARLMKPDEAHRLLYVDATPIERHLAQFEASLRSKGSVERYVKTTMTRLRRCIELDEVGRIGEIHRGRLPGLIEALRAFVDPDNGRTLTGATINDYLATYRQFTKWATPTLLPVDPLVNSTGVRADDSTPRRDILVEELALIVEAARTSRARYVFRGPDRAMLYLTAYGTGLRANELRVADVPWLRQEGEAWFLAMPEAAQKKTAKTRAVKQPVPQWLAAALREWLGERKAGRLFPRMPRDVAALFERDRKDARAAWIVAAPNEPDREARRQSNFLERETSDGEIVFHSHRHSYTTQALAALDIKSAQILTRHATAQMLLERYGHSRFEKAAAGAEQAIVDPMRRPTEALAQGAAHSTD